MSEGAAAVTSGAACDDDDDDDDVTEHGNVDELATHDACAALTQAVTAKFLASLIQTICDEGRRKIQSLIRSCKRPRPLPEWFTMGRRGLAVVIPSTNWRRTTSVRQ